MSIPESQVLEQALCQVLTGVPNGATTVNAGPPDPGRSVRTGAFLQLISLDETGECRPAHPVFRLTIQQRDRLAAWGIARGIAAWLPRRNVTGTGGSTGILFREIKLIKEEAAYASDGGERLFRICLELQTVL